MSVGMSVIISVARTIGLVDGTLIVRRQSGSTLKKLSSY